MVSHSQRETVKGSYKQSLKTLLPYGVNNHRGGFLKIIDTRKHRSQ